MVCEKYTTESAKWQGYSPATQKQQHLLMATLLIAADPTIGVEPPSD